MTERFDASAALRSQVKIHLTGGAAAFAAAALYWAFYRVFTAKFPLDFLSPVYGAIPLLGIPISLTSLARRTEHKRIRTVAAATGTLLFLIGSLLYKDQSVHYLLFSLYYEYPAPVNPWITVGVVLSILTVPFPVAIATRAIAQRGGAPTSYPAAILLATAAGLTASEALIPLSGAYAILTGATAAIALFLPRRAIAVATAGLCIAAGVVLYSPREAVFTWQLREYIKQESYWSRYYKIDNIVFDKGHCMGVVRNEIMTGYSCDSADKLPLSVTHLARVLSGGPIPKRKVLSVGRPDGTIPLAHKSVDPNVQRIVAVENDPAIVADMRTKYLPHAGNVFAPGGIAELVAMENRRYLDSTDEKFDIVYIDGVGLMLIPFPLTVIQIENYLFSSDAYERIFRDILTPDGILIVDRGTTQTDEAYDLAGSLPEDVFVKTFYTKINNFPMTGLPINYLIASRNRQELNRIAEELPRGRIYVETKYRPEEKISRWISDDRPFFQPSAIVMLYLMMLPFAALLMKYVRSALRTYAENPIGRLTWIRFAWGVVSMSSLLWLTSRGGRAFDAGPQTAFVWIASSFLCGMGAGYSILGHVWRSGPKWLAVAFGGGGFLLAGTTATPMAALGAAVATGTAIGMVMSGPARAGSAVPPGGLFAYLLGAIAGIFGFQLIFLLLGFRWSAGLMTAALLLRLREHMDGSPTPAKEGVEASGEHRFPAHPPG